ncbi:MAG: QueT transporter family protein [Clostridia bacterium]|nr:QueT transporter family protein [Clostridia bacterium]
MKNKRTKHLIHGAMIAALYVILTYVSALFGLSSGSIQLRISEALTILPIFTPAAIPGLFVGCAVANLMLGSAVWDVVFGSIATLLAAICTRLLRKLPAAAFLPPVIFNTLIVPPVIYFVYGSEQAMYLTYIGVFVGEALSCGIFGFILYKALQHNKKIFGEYDDI